MDIVKLMKQASRQSFAGMKKTSVIPNKKHKKLDKIRKREERNF